MNETLLSAKLNQAGLNSAAVESKLAGFTHAAQTLREIGLNAQHPLYTFLVPGRIEVLGKHTDYGGGRTLVAAVDKGFAVLACPRRDQSVHVYAPAWHDKCSFELRGEITPTVGHWSNYPMTVGRRIVKNFGNALQGADIAFVSDLPPASGMSSSSAFMIAIYMALAKVNALSERPEYRRHITSKETLAGYLATIENGQNFGGLLGDKGVGTFGGSEDHTAILCCEPGKMSQYSYCPVRFERQVPMPKGYSFAIAASGVVAEKTGAARDKYNQASILARRCAEIWREQTGGQEPHLAGILAGGPQAADRLQNMLRQTQDKQYAASELLQRCEHFRAESEEIIPAAGDALIAADLAAFGRFADLSQALAETLLGTQVPATISLARTARQLGAPAASAFGAGYGGSVWALIPEAQASDFLQEWRAAHRKNFPELMNHAAFFPALPGPAACEL